MCQGTSTGPLTKDSDPVVSRPSESPTSLTGSSTDPNCSSGPSSCSVPPLQCDPSTRVSTADSSESDSDLPRIHIPGLVSVSCTASGIM